MDLSKLNEQQLLAVAAPMSPILVLAAPGSGKTLSLTNRIAYLINRGVKPYNILAVTFTNKAANEMKERLQKLVGDEAKYLWAGTFHSVCLRILRMYGDKIGYKRGFSIYDDQDSTKVVKELVKEHDIGIHYNIVLSKIGVWKSNLIGPREAFETARDSIDQYVAEIYERYDEVLMANNAMDFDDIINNTVHLLRNDKSVLKKLTNRLHHVLVDEFQDINKAQYAFVSQLTKDNRMIFAVGDDAQCLAFGSKIKLEDGSEKKVEDIKVGDVVQTVCDGNLSFSPVTNLTINEQKEAIVQVVTESGHKMRVSLDHKCFASLPEFDDKHYVCLMWRPDKGFRIDVAGKGLFDKIVLGKHSEKPKKLWLLSQWNDIEQATLSKEIISLAYKILKRPYSCDVNLNQQSLDKLFDYFGQNGYQLLNNLGYKFEYPHFSIENITKENIQTQDVILYMGNKEGSCLVTFENGGERIRKQFSSSNAYKEAEEFAHRIKEKYGATDVIEKFIAIDEQELGVFPSIALLPTMKIPVEINGEIQLSKIVSVEICDSEKTVSLEVAKTGVVVADGVLSHNSIYKFRGADITNILNFEKDYPDATVVKLEQNYRSTKTIVTAGNCIIANNVEQKQKDVWTDNDVGDKITVHSDFNEKAEADWVAGKIYEEFKKGTPAKEIAILYRANYQSRAVEKAMIDFDIPYEIVGGLKFFERMEIKDLLAYLRTLSNPKDSVSFKRIINVPKRSIGNASVEKLEDFAKEKRLSLFEAALIASESKSLRGKGVVIENFAKELRDIGEKRLSVNETLLEIVRRFEYMEYLESAFSDDFDSREENILELLKIAEEYDSNNYDNGSISGFMQDISIQSDIDQMEDLDSCVKLMTAHNSKGLEFDTVFIVGLEQDLFPSKRSVEEFGIEEERRLFYVAVTRARKNLYLSYATSRQFFNSGIMRTTPSVFLKEIPYMLIEEE